MANHRKQRRVNPMAARLERAVLDATGPSASSNVGKVSLETAVPLPPPKSPESDFDADFVRTKSSPPLSSLSAPRSAVIQSATYSHRVHVRGSVLAKYAAIAATENRDVEEVMEQRLARFADATSDNPLTFTDAERAELMTLLGSCDPQSILRHIRNLVTASVVDSADAPVTTLRFTAQQLERAAFRCTGAETIQQKLQEYADYGINLNVGLS